MRGILAALFAITVAAGPAAASDEADVIARLQQYAAVFNEGDMQKALAYCAAQSAIIDEFPPYQWQGAMGCADWARDLDAFRKQNAITDPIVTLGRPTAVMVTGDRAYVVVPSDLAYMQNGKPAAERGAIWTVTLQKTAGDWRLTGWTWARH